MTNHSAPKRRRFTKPAILAGVAGSLAIALGMGASLSGYVAVITNNNNTAATGALAIQETQTTPTGSAAQCNSYDTTTACSSINKYGGTGTLLVPGGPSQTVSVAFKNAGTVSATTATLVPSACMASLAAGVTGGKAPAQPSSGTDNLCTVLNVAVYAGSSAAAPAIQMYSGPLSGFTATYNLLTVATPFAAGATLNYTFVISLPSGATTAVQGQQVSQVLTWTFNQ